MRLTKKIKDDIALHAKDEYPKESCGVIVNKKYIRCKNISNLANEQFVIDPIDIVLAESIGNIDAYVHSHPDSSSEPSEPDLIQMSYHGLPWIICGYIPDNEPDIKLYKPNNFISPLIGRSYYHGLQDCYTLIKDYYHRELNITLNDYERIDLWWENEKTESLYLNNFKKEGFKEVDKNDIRKHDVILFKLGRTYHVNHAGIFLDDGNLTSENSIKVIGNSLFLHHPYNRQSVREIYGNNWMDRTVYVIRHKDLI